MESDSKTHSGDDTTPDDWMDLAVDSPDGSPAASPAATQKPSEEEDFKLSLITWNVDGFDLEKRPERARGLVKYLNLHNPDVVFLQELVPPYVQFLKEQLVNYLMIEGGRNGCFTGMLLKKSRVKLVESEMVAYPTTKMRRNLLVAQVIVNGQKLCLMTSHFESCKENTAERLKQLHVVKRRLKHAPDDVTVVFGGDTNLRDAEVTKVGLPATVCDVWERLGKQEHCRYTWDTSANNNKTFPFVARCRFDRIYFRPAIRRGIPRLAPDHMALVGLEKLDCGRYSSDHWGIYCTFSAE
ncbi:tyrosyl-DNA phosphodiesterase 2-like [Astatotilapia calliptera]|uniref:tyrosyl-DNA phosphodiesterase 2-like n=1 Tax=Astatotilapia calliptera TaxID=8154 RepID=UPI000E42AE73|nr:tyrosyl-DNA phosphodiesterase 2-like [Astatotilapia calliptera]